VAHQRKLLGLKRGAKNNARKILENQKQEEAHGQKYRYIPKMGKSWGSPQPESQKQTLRIKRHLGSGVEGASESDGMKEERGGGEGVITEHKERSR